MSDRTELVLRRELDRSVDVTASAGGVALMRYVYRPDEVQYESPRPYVHPVRTLSGRLVTVFRPWDHVWHKGITLALPVVGRDNFWGGPTYTREAGGYVTLPNNGSQDHDRVTVFAQHGEAAAFGHELTWHRQPAGAQGSASVGDVVFSESRLLTVSIAEGEDAWVLGWRTSLTNASGAPIEMGSPTTEGRENAGYGGLFWRGPRSFTGGAIIASNGVGGEDVRGTRAGWAGFTGRHDGEDAASTIVFADLSPQQNLDTKWFARSEPFACLNPAPFFDRIRVVEPGETVELRYAVAIADHEADLDRMSALADAARSASERAEAIASPIVEEVN